MRAAAVLLVSMVLHCDPIAERLGADVAVNGGVSDPLALSSNNSPLHARSPVDGRVANRSRAHVTAAG